MAGGKETPRQKMIGIMYLVLLALLALQVSSAVMEKFILIDQSLAGSAQKDEDANDKELKKIAEAVAERGNKKEEQKLYDDAKDIVKLTHEIDEYLLKTREDFVQKHGGWTDPNKKVKPVGAKSTEAANEFFVGPKKDKEGLEIKNRLNGYVTKCNEILKQYGSKKVLPAIAMDGEVHPLFKKDKVQSKKKFPELYFGDSPMVAVLATLSELKAQVVKVESIVLSELSGQVGASDFKFDAIVPMYRAEANTVAAGTSYEGEMFISATSSTIKPKMKWNGKDIEVKDGMGKIKFRAAAGGTRQADGRYKKSWKGEISLLHPTTGKDTTFTVNADYYVVQPAIQISSGAVNSLYKDCGNLLNVNVPALGASYNPSFSVTGGQKFTGKKKGQVIIIPTAPSLTLGVSSGGTKIGNQKFSVKLVPKPEIIVYKGSKKVNLKNGEKHGSLSTLSIKAVCNDDSFKKNLPKDARYSVNKFEIMLVRGKRPVGKRTVNGGSVNVRSLFPDQREGDRILIEVLSVRRKNFKNKSLSVPGMGKPIINIPLS